MIVHISRIRQNMSFINSFGHYDFFCFSIFVLLIVPCPCKAADLYCNSSLSFTEGSKLEQNRNTVVDNLVQRAASSGGFNTTISRQGPNRIYGLLQCRGDLTPEKCYACSLLLNSTVRKSCSRGVSVIVFYNNKCYLRYETFNFIGKLDKSTEMYTINGGNATNPTVFSSAVKKLFSDLFAKVEESPIMYASGSTSDYSEITKIYALIQCIRDIFGEDCKACLRRGIGALLKASEGGYRLGGGGSFGSCWALYQAYPFFDSPASLPPPPSTQLSPSPSSKESSNKKPMILASLGGFIAVVLLLGLLFTARRKLKTANQINGNDGNQGGKNWPFSTLRAATRDFHEDNKLGEGGFGTVYKGTMPDGREIAVKKLSLQSPQGKQEFENEVKLLARIQHQNVVNFLGFCIEGLENLLVYEYLINKSLDKILFDSQRSRELNWQQRFNIILGIARGLLFLHEDSHPRIIHRDLKASNILLDDQMNPKIADFGIARLFPEDKSRVSTGVARTYGYLAPEYAMHGQLSDKADVYSFGIVLLEIVSGRKNIDTQLSDGVEDLLELVRRHI